jgi:HlyD family secretion protein
MEPEKLAKLKIGQERETARGGQRKRRSLVLVLVLVILSAGGFLVFQSGFFASAVPIQITTVGLVYPSQTLTDFNASGYVVAQRRASVASKATGRLEFLAVQEGSRVKQGDVLAELESNDLKAEYAQVAAQLAAARADLIKAETEKNTASRNFRRYRNLWDQKVVAQADFETAEDQHTHARAAVDSGKATIRSLEAAVHRAEVLIGYTVIRAPFDGVVLTKNADVGEVVAPFGSSINAKAAVVTMADLSSLMVQADVSESFLPRVHVEQACEIQLDALPDSRFPGRVDTIVPTADRTKGTVMVKVAFEQLDPRILPEMSAKIAFLTRPLGNSERQPYFGVHREVITQRQGAQGLFRITGDRAEWVPLPGAAPKGDYVVLGETLKAGEQVVLKPPSTLKAGDRVQVAE